MLLIFVGVVLGLALAGLAVFAGMCVAIRNDDKRGLPPQTLARAARLTRWFVGLSSDASARSPKASAKSQLVGAGEVQAQPTKPESR
jgi:hypothetical protein